MFGTLQPKPRELTSRQKQIYRNHYCGVCAGLGTHVDTLSRATLSHDAVLIALVAEGLSRKKSPKSKTRCPLNPLHHRKIIDENSRPIRYATAVHTLLVDLWFADKIEDSEAPIAKFGGKLWNERGQKARSILLGYGLDLNFVESLTKKQAEMEASNPTVSEASEVTEAILSYFFSNMSEDIDEAKKSKLAYFGTLIGRVIYLTDALKDIRKDRRRGHFNPCLKNGRIDRRQLNVLVQSLRESLVETATTLNLLDLSRTHSVCEEILTKHWPKSVEKEIARVEFLVENEGRKRSIIEKWQTFKVAFYLFLSQFFGGLSQAFEFQRHAFSQAVGVHQCDTRQCKNHIPVLAMTSNGSGFQSLKEDEKSKDKKKRNNDNSGDSPHVNNAGCCHCDCCDCCCVCDSDCGCCDVCDCCNCCDCF